MKRNYFISVAIATYNGEKYIKSQLESILNQLNSNDEIIISDDGSTDDTVEIINKLNDKRIKLIKGPKMGVKKNFENAILNCNGKYIFLSDQDDIWTNNKVEKVLRTFQKEKCTCVIHDCLAFDSVSGDTIIDSFYKFRNSGPGILKNIWKNSFIGCCMAFDRRLVEYIAPIPNNIEMHDQWIGIISEKKGKNVFINDILINYRRHTDNVSELKHHSLFKMIRNRIVLIKEYLRRV